LDGEKTIVRTTVNTLNRPAMTAAPSAPTSPTCWARLSWLYQFPALAKNLRRSCATPGVGLPSFLVICDDCPRFCRGQATAKRPRQPRPLQVGQGYGVEFSVSIRDRWRCRSLETSAHRTLCVHRAQDRFSRAECSRISRRASQRRPRSAGLQPARGRQRWSKRQTARGPSSCRRSATETAACSTSGWPSAGRSR
jgi:hypothetical protein